MVDARLYDIYFHAGRLFNTKRYANTKVAEIAAASGIATGTIYNLFTSKKAILTFVIRASLDKNYLSGNIELPIEEADMSLLLKLFNDFYDRLFSQIMCITDEQGHITKDFQQMLMELFDMNADTLLAANNIEYNENTLRELANVFFPARSQFLKMLENNLILYMRAGDIRPLEYPCVHVQCITDILTWWAMNAYIAMPDISVPRDKARQIAVDLVAKAYLIKT